jgi:hypothetical protein
MNTTDETTDAPSTDNTGFIWSGRLTVAAGFMLAMVLAAAKFAPLLAGPLEWQGK